eukprot:TRINITY_DN36668_c0_g1_i1.p1 TRINITY_DN36668_c0_g1~~TRINITY_DN36668_c0_g1_i1.p1  ORF type:complete len:288 (+),score=44.08 TRINITY_DN36668_c0_g1_i1:66-866(+)
MAASLLRRAGALVGAEGGHAAVGKGSGGMVIFVDQFPVDVTPDATVADVRRQLPDGGKHVRLLYQGAELRDGDLLADVGVCAESKIEMQQRTCLTWDRALLSARLSMTADERSVSLDKQGSPVTILSKQPLELGVPFSVRMDSAQGYFGVGFSPKPARHSFDQHRVASDGGGPGWSFNKNGECYGPWKVNPMEGMAEGRDPAVQQGDVVTFLIREHGHLTLTHKSGDRVREKEGSIPPEQAKQPLYAAVFFCNTAGTTATFIATEA